MSERRITDEWGTTAVVRDIGPNVSVNVPRPMRLATETARRLSTAILDAAICAETWTRRHTEVEDKHG